MLALTDLHRDALYGRSRRTPALGDAQRYVDERQAEEERTAAEPVTV